MTSLPNRTEMNPMPQAKKTASTQTQASNDSLDRNFENYIQSYKAVFSKKNSQNFDGKNYKDWSANDISKLNSGDLDVVRRIYMMERYDLVDQIKPESMSRAEFHRAILRESASNGRPESQYALSFGLTTEKVTITRPDNVPVDQQHTVTIDAAKAVLRDAGVAMLNNPRHGVVLVADDIAKQIGRKSQNAQGKFLGMPLREDTAAYDVGYTAGAVKDFTAQGSLPLSLFFKENPQQIQQAFCVAANDMYKPGRTLDQTEAFSLGFIQARMDAKQGFKGTEQEIGPFGLCPSSTPPLTNNDRLMIASRQQAPSPERN